MRDRRAVAILSGMVALSAYGGALGLIVGFLTLDPSATSRLPYRSPVLGGVALLAVVAVPSTVLAWMAWRRRALARRAAVAVGGLIVGWILVELAFIRELSFFHPTYVVIGFVLIWLGARRPRRGAVT